jgi:hypothetical protein
MRRDKKGLAAEWEGHSGIEDGAEAESSFSEENIWVFTINSHQEFDDMKLHIPNRFLSRLGDIH